jgi:capsular polysaccharide biosynthesis protein
MIPSNRNPHFLLDPETLAFCADLRDRVGSRQRQRKIFVSRIGWTGSYAATHRVMLNEEKVAERLAAKGFDLSGPTR